MCIGGNAASRAAEHVQNRRLVVGLGRLRQQVEVTLNEPRHRCAAGSSVALGAANHLFIHAEGQLRHIRMIARCSYVAGSRRSAGPRRETPPGRRRPPRDNGQSRSAPRAPSSTKARPASCGVSFGACGLEASPLSPFLALSWLPRPWPLSGSRIPPRECHGKRTAV